MVKIVNGLLFLSAALSGLTYAASLLLLYLHLFLSFHTNKFIFI
jgi:hypothetical protein